MRKIIGYFSIALLLTGVAYNAAVLLPASASDSTAVKCSKTYDPPSLASGTQTTTTVGCPGARLGDYARATFSLTSAGVGMSAYVSTADTVTVLLTNVSAGTTDLASGTLRVSYTPAL